MLIYEGFCNFLKNNRISDITSNPMEEELLFFRFMGEEEKMRYKVQEDNIPSINGEGGYERVITIMIESKETGRKYPSPVTDFIKTMYEYRGKSFNYQKDVATTICIFLNFIGDKVKRGG